MKLVSEKELKVPVTTNILITSQQCGIWFMPFLRQSTNKLELWPFGAKIFKCTMNLCTMYNVHVQDHIKNKMMTIFYIFVLNP